MRVSETRLKRKRSDPCRKSHGDPSASAANLLSSTRYLGGGGGARAGRVVISGIVRCCYVYVRGPEFQRAQLIGHCED